jgi:SAM-dependent methyltransferase
VLKINLGCGTNKLDGWSNHDADVDITKRLPWRDNEADVVFAEHVVEHVPYAEALCFFTECARILRPGGVCRIAVPSVERVWRAATADYIEFSSKWVPNIRSATNEHARRRGAMTNILFRHGHRAPWTQGLLLASLFYAGFDDVIPNTPGQSDHPELRDVEGHGRVIGDAFNMIETVVAEATR